MSRRPRLVITGLGVHASIGENVPEFASALRAGRVGLSTRRTPNGDWPGFWLDDTDSMADPQTLDPDWSVRASRTLRGAPPATRLAAVVASQALEQSGLVGTDAEDLGLIVGGNNIHQGFIQQAHQRFLGQPAYLNPRYALRFVDTGTLATLSELFGIRGPGLTVGGSAASGNLAIYQAAQMLRAGAVQALLCVGPMADLGALERQAFVQLGVLADGPAAEPRPFDAAHAGFVFGQASAALVLETLEHADARGAPVLAELSGVAVNLDAAQDATPSPSGETRAMRLALADAGLEPGAIDYLNAHGTGTAAGDHAECSAIRAVFGSGGTPAINSTKALVGHCLLPAGVLEAVAVVVQLEQGFLHPNPRLVNPIAPDLRFVGPTAELITIEHAMSNAFSFGGINSSIVISRHRSGGGPR